MDINYFKHFYYQQAQEGRCQMFFKKSHLSSLLKSNFKKPHFYIRWVFLVTMGLHYTSELNSTLFWPINCYLWNEFCGKLYYLSDFCLKSCNFEFPSFKKIGLKRNVVIKGKTETRQLQKITFKIKIWKKNFWKNVNKSQQANILFS